MDSPNFPHIQTKRETLPAPKVDLVESSKTKIGKTGSYREVSKSSPLHNFIPGSASSGIEPPPVHSHDIQSMEKVGEIRGSTAPYKDEFEDELAMLTTGLSLEHNPKSVIPAEPLPSKFWTNPTQATFNYLPFASQPGAKTKRIPSDVRPFVPGPIPEHSRTKETSSSSKALTERSLSEPGEQQATFKPIKTFADPTFEKTSRASQITPIKPTCLGPAEQVIKQMRGGYDSLPTNIELPVFHYSEQPTASEEILEKMDIDHPPVSMSQPLSLLCSHEPSEDVFKNIQMD
jgi:hypothetical protein